MGDLIDRGSQSEECLELLNKPWFFSVIGNHEYIFLEQFSQQLFDTSNLKVGNQWLGRWKDNPCQLALWFEVIQTQMPVCITLKYPDCKIGLVHAKPPIHWPVSNREEVDLHDVFDEVWDRNEFYNRQKVSDYIQADLVLMGHNPVPKTTLKGNRIWLDSKYSSGRFSILEVSRLIEIFKE